MVGSLPVCSVRAANGQTAVALPRSAMNSRRLMGSPVEADGAFETITLLPQVTGE
jgi:hypothetical protein